MKKLIIGIILLFGFTTMAMGADQWDPSDPAGSESPSDIDALIIANNGALDRALIDMRFACKIVYASASTITVETGVIAMPNSAESTVRWRRTTSNITVTWSDIDTGAEESSKTYYLYAVADSDATTFTVMISGSATSPTGATHYRRLGSFYNDSDGDIEPYLITNDNIDIDWTDIVSSLVTYDSGWFAVATNTTYTKTHSLNTVLIQWVILGSQANDDTDVWLVLPGNAPGSNEQTGPTIEITTTTIAATTNAYNVYLDTTSRRTSGYLRLVGIPIE